MGRFASIIRQYHPEKGCTIRGTECRFWKAIKCQLLETSGAVLAPAFTEPYCLVKISWVRKMEARPAKIHWEQGRKQSPPNRLGPAPSKSKRARVRRRYSGRVKNPSAMNRKYSSAEPSESCTMQQLSQLSCSSSFRHGQIAPHAAGHTPFSYFCTRHASHSTPPLRA